MTAHPAVAERPLVTLATDFGSRDPYAGLMKVQIHARCPQARIVDLTHDLPSFDPVAASFWIGRARRWCPAGTVHVAVVDPGVGTDRRLLAVESGGQYFLGPDNGLLGAVLTDATRVHAVDGGARERYGLGVPSATFHGRDLLAPLAAEVAAGRATVARLGPPILDPFVAPRLEPVRTADGWAGRIVLVDGYGNAYTDLGPNQVASGSAQSGERPTLEVAGVRAPLVRTYADAPGGSVVALVNSFDAVEIAVVRGSAAATLGLEVGMPVSLRHPVPGPARHSPPAVATTPHFGIVRRLRNRKKRQI